MRAFKFFIGFLVLCVFTIFAAANTQTVLLRFFITPGSQTEAQGLALPLFILIYLCFAIGFITAWILSFGIKRSAKKSISQMKKQIIQQEEELNKLRNLPVADPGSTGVNPIDLSTGQESS
ncbi:LapA family protein [bacterium]|nr:LapA family protein [candidate division CSSED10-310 bacterium]